MDLPDHELPEHILGSQDPTHRLWVPNPKYSYGDDAIALAAGVGLELDEWQQNFLRDGLAVVDGRAPDGSAAEVWAAQDVAIELSRQNGKSVVFEARVLVGLFLLRERVIVYSAHEGDTAKAAFERIEQLIRASPELHKEVVNDGRTSGFRRTNGQLQITLWTGQIVKFRTRTAGGGRGLSGDCVILDEAQEINDDHIAALGPTLSARPNPQLWWGGSAGNRKSIVLGRMIRRAEAKAPRLVMWRFASDDDAEPTSPESWARVNPALGRRMTITYLEGELGRLGTDKFGQEHMGIGDYPRAEGEDWVVPQRHWEAATDRGSKIVGPVVFSIEVKWDRTRSSIGVAGYRADGRRHVELIENGPGTVWTVARIIDLSAKHTNLGVVIDPKSPANTLVPALQDAGITVYLMKIDEVTSAFGNYYDALVPVDGSTPATVHTGGSILTSAMAQAEVRTAGGSTTWRRAVSADTSPALAVTWAHEGLEFLEPEDEEPPPSPQAVTRSAGGTSGSTGEVDLATAGF